MVATDEVARKLDTLIRLTAAQVMGERTGADAIGVLARAGLENDLIAELIGTTPATVRKARSRLAKSKKAKARKDEG